MVKKEDLSFEDALNLTGFGMFNLLAFLLNSSIIAGMVFEAYSVSYLVPASACELMTTSSQQGFMAGVPLIAIILTSHVWGYLADTMGRQKVLCYAMLLSCVCGIISSISFNWIFFSVFKLLSCGAISGALAISFTLISECTPVAKRGTMIVISSSVMFLCSAAMAAITIPILPLTFSYYVPGLGIYFNSWRLLTLIFCIPSAVSFIGLLFAHESPKYYLSVGQHEKALKVMTAIFVINNNKSSDEYPVRSVTLDEETSASTGGFWSSLKAQTTPMFKPPLLKNTLLLSVIYICVFMCLNPYYTWMPFIMDQFITSVERGDENMNFCQRVQTSQLVTASQNSTSNEEVANQCALNTVALTMTIIIGLCLSFVNVIFTFIIRYVSRKTLLISIQIVSGVTALLVNISTSWPAGAVFFLIFMIGVLNFGFLASFSVTIFPTYVKAVAVCVTLMVGRGSSVLGINVLKQMLHSDCQASFYIFGSITILGGILGFFLPGEQKTQKEKCPET